MKFFSSREASKPDESNTCDSLFLPTDAQIKEATKARAVLFIANSFRSTAHGEARYECVVRDYGTWPPRLVGLSAVNDAFEPKIAFQFFMLEIKTVPMKVIFHGSYGKNLRHNSHAK